jgi:glycosyltransferase involved in cell wall biosynthesis
MLLQNRPVVRAGQLRPIRVLHVVKELKGGGAETFVRGLARGLKDAGVDVRILSLYPDGLRDAERALLGVPVQTLDRRGRGDVAGFYPRLIAAVREAKPDIVHAHLHAGKYAGRIAAIAAGVPNIVFTEHGDEAGGSLRRAVNGVLHPRTARFVVFSESQRRPYAALEGVPLERVVAIPNGVAEPPPADRDLLRAELGLAADAFALYLPARLTAQKNQTVALRAFAAAFGGDERARLFLAGSGPLEAALRAEATALGLGDRVRFLGFRDDAARLGRAMDAFLMPSVWERMPLALGEAMLAGLPVVTSPWDGHADFVRDGVTGIVAGDPSALAFTQALERLRDAALRARIAGNAREFALGAFGLSACVARHIDLYAALTVDAR